MFPALLSILLLADTDPLSAARLACERDLKACAHYDELKATEKVKQDGEADRRYAEDQTRNRSALAEARADNEADEKKEAALKAKCGADYRRVRVGMIFARVRECAGEFELKGEDETGSIYESTGGVVRVVKGKVTRWIAK